MCLSNQYPNAQPSFSFLSIPFHQNVCKGKISFGLIENNYKEELKIGYNVDKNVELLGNPEDN